MGRYTPEGGSPVLVADDFDFRTEQAAVARLANLALVTSLGTQTITGAALGGALPPSDAGFAAADAWVPLPRDAAVDPPDAAAQPGADASQRHDAAAQAPGDASPEHDDAAQAPADASPEHDDAGTPLVADAGANPGLDAATVVPSPVADAASSATSEPGPRVEPSASCGCSAGSPFVLWAAGAFLLLARRRRT